MFLGRVTTGELSQVYRVLLQREPDASGVATYTGSTPFADALTVDKLRGILKGSAEYQQKAALLDPEFAKTLAVKNQLLRQRDYLKLTYSGAMPDEWLLDHLVFLLREVGITDLRQLAVRQKSFEMPTYGINQATQTVNTQTFYYPEYYHRDTGFVITGASLAHPKNEGDNVWAVNYKGKGGTRFHVQYVQDVPVFYTSYKATNFFETEATLLQIIGVIASFAGLPPIIGSSITNAIGVTASVATQKIVGQIAMSTLLSGGDVGNAVKSAAINLVGGELGEYARAASGSKIIGVVADASATAAITGEDITSAIAADLAQAGLSKGVDVLRQSNIDDYDFSIDSDTSNFAYSDVITTPDILDNYFSDYYAFDSGAKIYAVEDYSNVFQNTMDKTVFTSDELADKWERGEISDLEFRRLSLLEAGIDPEDAFTDYTLNDIGIDADPVALSDTIAANFDELEQYGLDVSGVLPDDNGNLFLYSGEIVEFTFDDYVNNYFIGENGALYDPYGNEVAPNILMANATAEDIAVAIDDDVRAKAGTVVQKNFATPRPNSVAAVTNSGRVPPVDNLSVFERVGNMAIKLYSTFKAGAQTFGSGTGVYRPQAVGVPITLADGSTVVNNGNGTVTRRYLDGTVSTTSSNTGGGGLFGGISTNTLLIGGAVIVGALLLSRRK